MIDDLHHASLVVIAVAASLVLSILVMIAGVEGVFGSSSEPRTAHSHARLTSTLDGVSK